MASAILTLPEGPPADDFFRWRLEMRRGEKVYTSEIPGKQGGQPAAEWPNSR